MGNKFNIISKILLITLITLLHISLSCSSKPIRTPDARNPLNELAIESYFARNLTTGKVIIQKEADAVLPAASTIKMITALIAAQQLKDMEIITIKKEATDIIPTKAFIRDGEQYRFGDLLKAMLILSANDVALAVALHLSKTEEKFVEQMNIWCKQKGLESTEIADVSGLSPKSVSSARDLAKIYTEFTSNRKMKNILRCRSSFMKSLSGRTIYIKNTNYPYRFLREQHGTIVGKTGTTGDAKFCFVGEIFFRKHIYLISMMGAEKLPNWQEASKLIQHINSYLKRNEKPEDTDPEKKEKRNLNIDTKEKTTDEKK